MALMIKVIILLSKGSISFQFPGQQYNQDGVLTPWWTNASVTAFKKKTQCFVNQYSQYSMFGYHVSG